MTDFNRQIIDEFRKNEGSVESFGGKTLVLLHTTGAKSGQERVNPVMYRRLDSGELAVFASKAGAPTDPDWFRNLVAHPEVTVETGSENVPMVARVAEGEERDRLWEEQKAIAPGFADYEAKTDRQIPVVVLSPA